MTTITRSLTVLTRKVLGVSAILVGIGAGAAAQPIPVGVGVDPGYVSFFVAQHEKLFEKHGVDVRLVHFASGAEAHDALIAGTAFVAAAAEPTVMIRMGRGDVRALGVVTESGRFLKMIAKANIDNPAQIASIGVVPGGVMEYLADVTMTKYKLDRAKIKVVKAGPPEMPALLARGDIDAFWMFEPIASTAVAQGGRIIARSGDVGYVYNFWVTAAGGWLDTHKKEASAILKALQEACVLTTADPQRAAQAVQAIGKVPAKLTIDFLSQVQCKMRDFTPQDLKSYEAIAGFLADVKITPKRVDFRKQVLVGFFDGSR